MILLNIPMPDNCMECPMAEIIGAWRICRLDKTAIQRVFVDSESRPVQCRLKEVKDD